MVSRFDVYLVRLDSVTGDEIKKTIPCVVVSPDEMNQHQWVVIIAPLTSVHRPYPTRVPCEFSGKPGDEVALEYLRSIDCSRLIKKIGELPARQATQIADRLQEMFALG